MYPYLHIFNLIIPSYGFLIALGVIIANIFSFLIAKYTQQDFNDFILLEAYCFLGAFLGSKLLYLIVSFKTIEWDKIFNFNYFNNLMLTGFVFYGGLILGLIFVLIGGKIHKINSIEYIKNFIFVIPFIHCFGRIGCFMAGCCYGIPYKGFGAVTFPDSSFALSKISLFPVQLLEAFCLILISLTILYLQMKMKFKYTVEFYFISYAILRFVLEKFRYDDARGFFLCFSTSQWISISLIIVGIFCILYRKLFHNDTSKLVM